MNTAIALPVDAPAVVPSAGAMRVPAAQTTGQGFGQCLASALFPLMGMANGQAPAIPARPGTAADPAAPQLAGSPIDPAPVNATLIAVPDVTQAPASATPVAPVVAAPNDDAGTPPAPVAAAPPEIPEPDAIAKPASPGKPNATPGPRNGKSDKDDKAPALPAAAAPLPLLVVVAVEPPPPPQAAAIPEGTVAPPNVTAIDTAAAKPHARAPAGENSPDIASPSPTSLPTHTSVMSDPEPAGSLPHLPTSMPLDTSVQLPSPPSLSSPAPDVAALDTSAAPLTRSSPAEQVAPAIVSILEQSRGARQVTVQLHPSELGQVQIRIVHTVDAAPRIEISAERPQTLALLQRDEPQLHRALDQAGVMPEGRALTFHLSPADAQDGVPFSRSGDATFDMAGQRQGSSSQPQSQGSQAGTRDDLASEPQPLPTVTRWFRAGIDITA